MFRLLIFVCISSALSYELPRYIIACKETDPNFNECAKTSANNAIPSLIKGDKRLKLRVLDPLFIPQLSIEPSPNLKLNLTNVYIGGLGNAKTTKMNFDRVNNTVSLQLNVEAIYLNGTYDINGRILILPITGNGPINIKLDNAIIDYGFNYGFEERKGKTYLKPLPARVALKYQRSHYKLDNLFGGDKRLGDEMNRFLNENWEELSREINPTVAETISIIATEIVENIMSRVPYKQIVL